MSEDDASSQGQRQRRASPPSQAMTGVWDEPLERLLPAELVDDDQKPRVSRGSQADRSQAAYQSTQRLSKDEVVRFLKQQSPPPAAVSKTPEQGLSRMVVGGRYEVVGELGEGGMSQILKVRHVRLGREFALKVVLPNSRISGKHRAHLMREAQMISQLEHPNIVQVTDFGEDEHWGVFIVMEYLKGETLHDRLLQDAAFGLPLALHVARQVAEALVYMHEQRIIHRDVKPENIFLCRPPKERRQKPTVKIIDFGLSGSDAGVTMRGASGSVGTPAFMAPEQLRGQAPRPSMDIYAVGVLLYEMVTGMPPFVGDLEQIVAGHLLANPRLPSDLLEDPLDERLEALILKALAKRPSERQETMAQLVYELRTVMDMLGLERRRAARSPGRSEPVFECADDADLRPGWLAFETSPCPMFSVDADARIVAANEAFGRFVHLPHKELCGRWLVETVAGRLYPEVAVDVRQVIESQVRRQRVVTVPRDPPARVLLWLVPAVDPHAAAAPATVTGLIIPLAGE